MRSFSFLFLVLFLASVAPAAPFERDLGQGLAYFRVHRLPIDLPGTPAKKPRALILDLRYTESSAAGADALDAWLKFRAAPASPVLLLVNRATPSVLIRMLANRGPAAGLLALGPATAEFAPDITLDAPADAERLAYDALEQGATAASLITDPSAKPRHDEAELVQQHRNSAPAAPLADDPPPAAEPKPSAAPPLADRALQRAVHIHRTLLALRKLPPG